MNTLSSVSIALVVALATGAFKAYAQSALPADTAQTLEVIRKQYNLPALAVVIAKDGKICERAAVGVRKLGDPTLVATNDQFHIGSCTKSMTATLAAMLIEEGKLHWDTTIADVFPELKGKIDKQFETVTVEQLLNHRAGVCREPPAAAWMQACEQKGTPTQQRYEFIKAALAQPPDAKPGTKFIYSNQGYATVGAILERIAGQPLESLITDKLFKPLHMDSAGFGPPGTTGQVDQPWGHTRSLGGIQPCQKDNPPAIAPAGTVHCSLDDLGHYTIFHMEGEQKDGLLNAETIRKLHTPPEGGDYTCGWLVVKRFWAGGPAIMHDGSNGMWYIVMWLAPEKDFSVVIATNISGPDAAKACDEVVRTMIRKWLAYLDKPIELK